MKRLFSFLTFFILSVFCIAQNWERINPYPTGYHLADVYFIDSLCGFAIGEYGTFMHTTDGGITWTNIQIGTSSFLISMCFIDKQIGYLGSQNHQFYKTIDSGMTWSKMNTPFVSYGLIYFINSNIGFIPSTSGKVFKTTDGGLQWTEINSNSTNPFGNIYFPDSKTGYATNGNNILKTTDSGDNWQVIYTSKNFVQDVAFKDSLNGYVVGNNGTILRTDDGGNTWKNEYVNIIDNQFYRLQILGNNSVFICGIEGGKILKNANDTSWVIVSEGKHGSGSHYSLHFPDTITGYIVGRDGLILKTIDGGATWSNLNKGPAYKLSDIAIFNESRAYIVGWDSIHITADGGDNWNAYRCGLTNSFNTMYFFDSLRGFIAYSMILKTIDGGKTWSTSYVGGSNYKSIGFFSEGNDTVGYAVGETILKTTDVGKTWEHISNPILYMLNSVYFTDLNTGYIACYGGYILKTIDAGANWTVLTSGTSFELNSILFTEFEIGYAVGNNGVILKTTNSGNTWQKLSSGTQNNLQAAWFFDSYTGYVVGDQGTILKTNDGGLNWTSESTLTYDDFQSIKFYNNNGKDYGLICGTRGAIFRKIFTASPILEYKGDQADFKIYPNPATNQIIINSKQKSVFSGGQILIYSIEGKLLCRQSCDETKTFVDISSLKSGVYLIQVINNEKFITVKFVKE